MITNREIANFAGECLILNVRDTIDNFGQGLAFADLDWLWDH